MKSRQHVVGVACLSAIALFCAFGMYRQPASPQGGSGVPNTFVSGATASASQINANFAALVNRTNLTGSNIVDGSLTGADLAANTVTSGELADSIGASQLAAQSSTGLNRTIVSTNLAGGGFLDVAQQGTNTSPAVRLTTGSAAGSIGGFVEVFGPVPGITAVQLLPNGSITKTGTVSFVHPHPNDASQQIVYVALEGPEQGTYFRGSAQLATGTAVIVPPEHFRHVTSAEGITVQVTPRGPCNGLYVESATREMIAVRELLGGTSHVAFDYYVNGVRQGFESHAVYQPNTMYLPTGNWQGDLGKGAAPALIQNGILNADGSANRGLVDSVRLQNADYLPAGKAPEPADLSKPR